MSSVRAAQTGSINIHPAESQAIATPKSIRIRFFASADKSPLSTSKKQLLGVQYLRGLAALMVIFTHTGGTATIPKYFGLNLFGGYYQWGAVGVHLFFVISGFVIAYVSFASGSLQSRLPPAEFLRRRFIRIIPFLWLCVIGHALLMVAGRRMEVFPFMPYLRSLFLFPVGDVLPNQTWTIRHEFLFYLVFCFTALFSTKKLWLLLLWTISPLIWYCVGVDRLLPNGSALVDLGNFFFSSYNLLFGLGLVVGVLRLKGKLPGQWYTRNGFLICLVCAVGLVCFSNALIPLQYQSKLASNALVGLLSAVFLLGAISLQTRGALGKLDRLGLLLGDASYSIYLTHCAVISCLYGVWSTFQKTPNPILLVTVTATCCCVGGILVHKWVEKPLIRFLSQKVLFHRLSVKCKTTT